MFKLPTKVDIEVIDKEVTIKFEKNESIFATEIHCSWNVTESEPESEPESGEEEEINFDPKIALTYGNAFWFNNLELGSEYSFKLKIFSINGEVLESELYTFKTEDIIIPTLPTNVTIELIEGKKYSVAIKFDKGECERTEIDCHWKNGENTWDDYTKENSFFFEDLEWGTVYKFRLRSLSNDKDSFVDTEDFTFETPVKLIASAPYDIVVNFDEIEKNKAIISYAKGQGILTEMVKLWEESKGWLSVNSPIIIPNLEWGKEYKFKLRESDAYDGIAETEEISFTVTPPQIPTSPTDITVEVDKTTVYIKFKKGDGVKTEIDLGAIGNWSSYTTDEGFVFNDLEQGKKYKFKLRTVSSTGHTTESDVVLFEIKEIPKATSPTNVEIKIDLNDVLITFKKGTCIKTQINKYWVGEEDSYDEDAIEDKFNFKSLEAGKTYKFKLRSVGEGGDFAETKEYSFEIPKVIEPTPPTNIVVEDDGHIAYIKFVKGAGVKTGIDAYWIDGSGTIDEYSTDNGFVMKDLLPGVQYKFKLISIGIDKSEASSEEISFTTKDYNKEGEVEEGKSLKIDVSDISTQVEGRCVTIKFPKAKGVKVYINSSWPLPSGSINYTSDGAFFFENLTPDTLYSFTLTSGAYVTPEVAFKTLKDGQGGEVSGGVVEVEVKIPDTKLSDYEERWFFALNNNQQPIGVTSETDERFIKYDVYYEGDTTDKEAYLTFDEGYETGNTIKMADVLDKHGVKGTFFITNLYLQNNTAIVKELANRGHIIGNHSSTHPAMANVAKKGFNDYKLELLNLAHNYKSLIGEEISKLFRPPMGKYSELSLSYTKDLGYKTMLWSYAYADWNTENQKEIKKALTDCYNHRHNGVIYLLHAVSSTNAAILDELITKLIEDGYTIKPLTELPERPKL